MRAFFSIFLLLILYGYSYSEPSKSKSIYNFEGQSKNLTYDDNNNKPQSNDNNVSSADLYKKVLELEEKVRELNGKVQYSDYTYQKIIEKINNLSTEMNYRFSKIEKVENVNSNTNKSPIHPIRQIAKFQAMINEKKYKEVSVELLRFVEINKDKTDLDEAYYLLGKAYTGQNMHEKAATYFLKSYKNYPDKPRAADSLLYLSRSLAKLEKIDKSCTVLSKLEKEYPYISKEEKRTIKLEKQKLQCK